MHEHYALWFANALFLSRSITYSSLSFHVQEVLAHYCELNPIEMLKIKKKRLSLHQSKQGSLGLVYGSGKPQCPPVCVVLPIRLSTAQGCKTGCLEKRKSDPRARKSSFSYPFYNI